MSGRLGNTGKQPFYIVIEKKGELQRALVFVHEGAERILEDGRWGGESEGYGAGKRLQDEIIRAAKTVSSTTIGQCALLHRPPFLLTVAEFPHNPTCRKGREQTSK